MKPPAVNGAVEQYLNGVKSKFQEIYDYLSPHIHDIVNDPRYRKYGTVEDLTQECWILTLEKLPKWDAQRGGFRQFVIMVCHQGLRRKYMRKNQIDLSNYKEDSEYLEDRTNRGSKDCAKIDLQMPIRFFDIREKYIIQRACNAIFANKLELIRGSLVKDLKTLTGWQTSRINFLIDYTKVTLRKSFVVRDSCEA